MKNNILIIFGSSRSDGNTRMMVDFLLEKLPADWIELSKYEFGYYDYEYQNQDDDFPKLADQMLQYEQIIFCTPVYWYAMSAVMKTYFDRLSDLTRIHKGKGRGMAGKKMYALCCSSDQEEYEGFFMPFEKTAGYLDMDYGGHIHTWVEDNQIPEVVIDQLLKFCDKIMT